ncbi:MAG: 3-phosphoshikimate 1-carboxyvinyltransferase [Chloroflexota bacterium]|nr:3-phosphoshikimate 1-carboxyvinyltransferase [Chloroflexota bacterium]
MEQRIDACTSLRGEIAPPGDKSISHRALILNSIAKGKARIENLGSGDDIRSTMSCLRGLGIEIEGEGDTFSVAGVGLNGFKSPDDVLNAGNSGTTMRLLSGLLAAQPFLSIITGDDSLRSRPMDRVIRPLRLMGAEIWGRRNDTLPPLAIRGHRLKAIGYRLPVASAQLKSAILIAGLFAEGKTIIEEKGPSRDHTERLISALGVKITREGKRIELSPSEPRSPVDVRVPGDISSAAFWLVAGAVHPDARLRITNVGINPTRAGIIDVLLEMGAKLKVEKVTKEGGEPVADISIESSELIGTRIGGAVIPRIIDELPLVALAGAFARGTTVIKGAQELRVKESDRIATTVGELSKLGVDIEEMPDGMVIRGGEGLTGAECDSHGDHRLAMTLGVAALVARGETVVDGAEAVSVSYPGFWDDLKRLTGGA